MGCYIRVSTHIAGLAVKPKDVLDTLDLTNFGVKLFLYIGVRSVTIKDFSTLHMSSFPVQVDRSLRPQRLMTKSLVPTTFLLKIGPVTIFTGKSLRTRLVTKTTYI